MTKNQTSFKKGNQIAKGNPNSGRPREYDSEVEAEALLEWCMKPEATILRMFAPLRGYAPSRMDDWLIRCPVFRGAYAVAKAIIGCRREQILIDAGSTKPFERYADFYDDQLYAFENTKEEKKATAKARAEAQTLVPLDTVEQFKAFMSMLKENQESARNNSKSNNKAADKSM